MRYEATILGGLWWPMGASAVVQRKYRAESDPHAIDAAYTTEAGDFSSVKDVHVVRFERCGECSGSKAVTVKDWDNEENECEAMDYLYGEVEA